MLAELDRRRRGTQADGRLALVVAGGGMRGVCTGGMLAGLEDLGVEPSCFDVVVGVSAGSVGAAYYLAGSARSGVTVYWDHLPRLGFVSPRRLLRGGPLMDLDVLLDQVLGTEVPLDHRPVLDHGGFHVVASSPSRVGSVALTPTQDRVELLGHLRASCHVPLLAGRAPTTAGEVLFDGSLTEPVPVPTALAAGATHVLVLSSTRPDAARARQSVPEMAVSRAYDVRFPGVHRVISDQVRSSRGARRDLAVRTAAPSGPPFVFEVVPPAGALPGQLCTDPGALERAATLCREQVAAAIGRRY